MSIMKKIVAMILIAALCLSTAALAEEAPAVTAADYLGEWVDLDGTCNINITEHTDGEIIDGYVVEVEMPIIAEESLTYVRWAYGCVWDDETQTLKSNFRFTGKGDYEPGSEEEITDSNLDYTAAAFSFDEEGRFTWSDENETADDGLAFVRPIGWGESAYAGFQGEWVECETQFTQMTIEMNPQEGLDVEIAAPLTHGAYIFKTTVQYDENQRCFTYNKGKFWAVPITEEENPELGEAKIAGTVGTFTFTWEEDRLVLTWVDDSQPDREVRFERAEADAAAALTFTTIGEAMASEGYTGIAVGDDEHYVVVVERNGAYLRLVADVDDEARRLGEATLNYVDADTLEAAFEAYNAYIETLPIAYEEEITAQPKPQKELDALAGKTLLEVEEAGYEHSSSEMGENDEAIYTVSYGMYAYNLLLNETYTEYMAHSDDGFIGDLTVKSVAFSGISRNAGELRYHADGTYDEENDPWAEFNAIMNLITEALSGENPEEAVQALIEKMPDQANEIRMFAEIFSAMGEQNDE